MGDDELVPREKVGIIPNGVDSKYFMEKKIERRKPPRILYGVTNFEWLQNQEPTELLIKKVWPLVKDIYPSAKIWIVGRKIPSWVKESAKIDPDIEITENSPDATGMHTEKQV